MNDFKKVLDLLTKPQKVSMFLIFLLILVGMLFETLSVGIVLPILSPLQSSNLNDINPYLQHAARLFDNISHTKLITFVMLGMATLFILKSAFLSGMYWIQYKFVFKLQAELSKRLFEHYLHAPMTFHLSYNSANLIRNINQEVHLLTQGAIMATLAFLTESFVAIGIALLLLIIEPIGASIVLITLILVGTLFLNTTKTALERWGKERQKFDGLKIQMVQQGLGAIKDVKILGRERSFLNSFVIPNEIVAKIGVRISFLQTLPKIFLELFAILGLVILVLVMISKGKEISEVTAILGLFAAAAFRLLPSANRILGSAQSIRYNRAAVDLIYNELTNKVNNAISKVIKKIEFSKCIEFNDVCFSYENSEKASLTNISVKISQGETIGVKGTSGAGKSTLVDTFLGLLAPQKGQILVDGEDIQPNLNSWQRKIGYVPQEIYLTDDTLKRNIAFGVPEAEINNNAVKAAVKAAQLDEVIKDTHFGLETVVGERGVRLSGGQRQRIGIARALYNNPDILVLDEATSALDIDTEASVMKGINALKKQKTIIIVTHRLSTIENCDRIFEIQKGFMRLID